MTKNIFLKMITVILCFTIVLAFSIVGCKTAAEEAVEEESAEEAVEEAVEEESAEEAVEEESDEVVAEEQLYFAIISHGGDDPFWSMVKNAAEDAAELYGVQLTFSLDGGDLSAQRKSFDEAVSAGADAIAVVLNDPEAWNQPVQDALDAGIPVIGFNGDVADNPRLCYVGGDDYNSAYLIGKRLVQEAKDAGIDVKSLKKAGLSTEVPGAAYAVQRVNGITDAFEENDMTAEVEVIDAGGLDATLIEERTTAYLLANPDIKMMFGAGSITTEMLTASLKGAGYEPGEIVTGGFGTSSGTVAGIKEGYINATIDVQPYSQGYLTVVTLYLLVNYGLSPNIDTAGSFVDASNVEQLEALSGTYR
jgi:simple sugar transport system substrate-binding protein